MFLQKEYTESHITHKSKKNNGELPMYWVENSHEAIIPLETYQKVQDEIKRRRDLGALANWHIPTSHFTSKIKCGCCGASFVKSTRKNRAKCSQIGEKYSFYMCASKKKGSSPCTSGTIRESVLEGECAKVLGIPVFDPEAFTELVIDGGCHAYFGVYGPQDGDGTPEISNEEQISLTAEAIAAFVG